MTLSETTCRVKATPFGYGLEPDDLTEDEYRQLIREADAEGEWPDPEYDRWLDRLAAERAAEDRLSAWLMPRGLADALSRGSLVGHDG